MRPDIVRTQGLLADVDRITEELLSSVDRMGLGSASDFSLQKKMLQQIDQNLQEAEKQLGTSRKFLTRARMSLRYSRERSQHWSPRDFLQRTKHTFEAIKTPRPSASVNCTPRDPTLRTSKSRRGSSLEYSRDVQVNQCTPHESCTKTPQHMRASSSVSNPAVSSFQFLEDSYQADYEDDATTTTSCTVMSLAVGNIEEDDATTRTSCTVEDGDEFDDVTVFFGKRSPVTSPRDDCSTEPHSDKRSPPISPRQGKDPTVVRQGWLDIRDSPTRAWKTLWCILFVGGDFVYYTNQAKTGMSGYFKFVPQSTIHSFDDPCRMEVVAAHLDPESQGVHFKASDASERSAWSAAISQPHKYMEVMNMLRQQCKTNGV